MGSTRRVLYLISSLHRGGAERQLAALVSGLDRDRWEAHVALCDATNEFGPLPAALHDLRSADGATPLTLARITSLVRALRPAVVHGFGGLVNIHGRLAARATGAKAISSVRNGRPPARDMLHERLTWRLSAATLANSVGIRDILVREAGIPAARVEVIENGVDLRVFAPLDEGARREARARWGMEGTTLVMPARVTEEKNHRGVIEALATLRGRGVSGGGLRVLFAGRAADAGLKRSLDARARSAGLTDLVRFVGVVDDAASLMAASDGVLLPSRFEGMPNVVLEAMASGVPALVSPAANLDALVGDEEEGVVFHGTSPGALVEGLARFARRGDEGRRSLGRRGRAKAEARFGLETMVARTEAVYARVLHGENAP